jgi:Hg(II)-responsive transcriptional regulator
MEPSTLTIGVVARAAGVNVETVRYYQRRGLLPVPASARGSVRRYPRVLVDHLRFIKRAQTLGFNLEEVRELLQLESGGSRAQIRRIAAERLHNIHAKISALQQMQRVLSQLLHECQHATAAAPCPIIAALNRPHGDLNS